MSKDREAVTDAVDEDDHIAQLLAKDARDCSIRYSSLGMYRAAPARPEGRVPKPNTRFLKNILRDTDKHNANLKKKEEEEAQERMRRLRRDRTSRITRSNDGERESKRRRVESPPEGERPRERKRSHRSKNADHEKEPVETRRRDTEPRRKHERRDNDPGRIFERRNGVSSKPTRDRRGERCEDERHHHRRHRHKRRDESRKRSPDVGRTSESENRNSRKSRRSHRSRSPRRKSRSRDHSHNREGRRMDKSASHSQRHASTKQSERGSYVNPSQFSPSPPTGERKDSVPADTESPQASDSDDDPLSNLIGPLPPSATKDPPLRCRGRGAYKTFESNIDTHFSFNYDPSLDVHLNDDDDTRPSVRAKGNIRRPVAGLTTENDDIDNDWDMALEALRDRALWRRKGADRLREAGFEENVVERWANSKALMGLNDNGNINIGSALQDGQDKDATDVRWAKKGEGREWDRGKVVNDEGHVDIRAPW